MVSVALCIIDSVSVIESIVRLAHMYALLSESSPDNVTKIPTTTGPLIGESKDKITVRHYAKHELCKNFDGKKYFYKAIKTTFCSLTSTFTAKHVFDLCRNHDYMLVKWVSALFDFDGDGYITHLERTYYE
ncbi:uncharacterized protein LOC132726247 [Ruditapes philippinarum]|uniref:uncharacterized protein LOC132726247 n=1 Tax=Ruditapes philippinarum TaxID=129788 RepID=UPI00295C07C8|nr:uncharacterized protein LOC132726247 [Ruditapes philippinarum]